MLKVKTKTHSKKTRTRWRVDKIWFSCCYGTWVSIHLQTVLHTRARAAIRNIFSKLKYSTKQFIIQSTSN